MPHGRGDTPQPSPTGSSGRRQTRAHTHTQPRGWDRAAVLVTHAATSSTPQKSYPHARLELSLSQTRSWDAPQCHDKGQLLDLESAKKPNPPRLRCLSKRSWCLHPSCASQQSEGTLALGGPMGCRVMPQNAKRDLVGKFLPWGRQLTINQISRFRRITGLVALG